MAGCRSLSSLPSCRLSSVLEGAGEESLPVAFGDVGLEATRDSNALAPRVSPHPESRRVAHELWVLIVGGVIFGEASG